MKNNYWSEGEITYVEIRRRNGDEYIFMIDTNDLPIILPYTWGYQSVGYVAARIDGKYVLLHRFLTSPQPNEIVDHEDVNTMNNRRKNLRHTNHSRNGLNRRVPTGVHFDVTTGKFRAQVMLKRKHHHIGLFSSEHLARDAVKGFLMGYDTVSAMKKGSACE